VKFSGNKTWTDSDFNKQYKAYGEGRFPVALGKRFSAIKEQLDALCLSLENVMSHGVNGNKDNDDF